jgi:PhzF family phenazine biosynthesis protein
MDIQVQILNAFTDNGVGGNPAGVVLQADDLNAQQKLAIAARVGYSETAFVSASKSAAFKLEFFTPTRQIAHCGHATVATFSYLKQLNYIHEGATSKETTEGNRDIFIDGNMAFMEQLSPGYSDVGNCLDAVIQSLGISTDDLAAKVGPMIVNTGNSFVIVPMKSEQAIAQVRPDFDAIHQICEDNDLIGYYIFSTATRNSARDAGARMFAPRFGIDEESATGMAAGPLACFLHDKMNKGKDLFLIEQGHLMSPASPSLITARLKLVDDEIDSLMVGGEARAMRTLTISI